MARYVPAIQNMVAFADQNGVVTNIGNAGLGTYITDNKPGSNTFEPDEALTIGLGGGQTFTAKYVGTISVGGQKYVVVLGDSNSIYYVVGLRPTTEGIPSTLVFSGTGKNVDDSNFTVCFFIGTLIATPSGERKVEELVSGDQVLIGDSGAIPATWLGRKFARTVSVKWIGRQSVSTLYGPAERLMPVRFSAGSLGGGGNHFCRIANLLSPPTMRCSLTAFFARREPWSTERR